MRFREITRIEEAAKLSSVGSHSKKVIQASWLVLRKMLIGQ